MSSGEHPNPERDQTDESLRVERAKVDDALGETPTDIEETADAVIVKARERADAVLAAARAKVDRRAASRGSLSQPPRAADAERALEDKALSEERADADETLREERAERAALLSAEREETDKDLSRERARSDVAVATRDEFLGIVGHDLRNLLNVVVGFAGLIVKGVSREEHLGDVLMYAKRIERSGARMNRLIGDLVDVASIEAGALAVTLEVADPVQVVSEAVETFQAQASASGVSLRADIVSSSPAPFDAARILQVLTNLISNAIKFTPAKGAVVVRVEQIGDDLRLSVSDTGVGIPRESLEAVFERFHQLTPSDRRGVGLGLYISKCIVQGHGGRIWAESSVGGGSTFSFTLPMQERPSMRAPVSFDGPDDLSGRR